MNRAIDPDASREVCQRCGGARSTPDRRTRAESRPCQCWDPLVEWLMDRSERRN